MCLYPKLIHNPKYKATQKNGGNIPPIKDQRVIWVPIGCQKCIECRKQKARQWQIRIQEHIKTNTNGKFITLTFSTEKLREIVTKLNTKAKGYALDNAIATYAVRHFLERWRKKYKKSLQHWLITELGGGKYQHMHIHGIIWVDNHIKHKNKYLSSLDEIEKIWENGFVWKGHKHESGKIENYVSARTANYITKYINKADELHPEYIPVTLCSPGIGSNYTNTYNAKRNVYKPKKTNELYKTSTGHDITLPIYYRNKIYSDHQRELLWIEKLDKQRRYICGEEISVKDGLQSYFRLLEWHRRRNTELKYGGEPKDWKKKRYETQLRQIQIETRLNASGGEFSKRDRD